MAEAVDNLKQFQNNPQFSCEKCLIVLHFYPFQIMDHSDNLQIYLNVNSFFVKKMC